MDKVLEVIKWVAVIFVAGFIGYFGKYLSKIIISKLRKEPKKPLSKHEYKLEKKRLKAEKKKYKD